MAVKSHLNKRRSSAQSHRTIQSRFPAINLFESIVDVDELEAAFYIESLTNDRLREEVGDLALVAKQDRICGPGTTSIMAAFTHIGRASRFTNGDYGVYYAASSTETAIAETQYHQAKFLSATNEADTKLSMREYCGHVHLPMLDVRDKVTFSALYHLTDYARAQAFAVQQRKSDASGLLYNSVRRANSECIAAFKPIALSAVLKAKHFIYYYKQAR
jgi:hypothetical protein